MRVTSGFGARLRTQRERQGISLEAISADTKIRLSLLEELEADNVSHWPEGIFRRAYIRAYAHAVGLEPDPVVREFLETYPDTVEVLPAGATAWPEPNGETSGPRRLIRSAMAAAPAFLQGAQSQPAMQLRVPVERAATREHVPDLPEAHDAVGNNGSAPAPLEVAVVDSTANPEPQGVEDAPATHEPRQRAEPDLRSAAMLCARFATVSDITHIAALLKDATETLDAAGFIVWLWDPRASALRPALANGYSESVLARFAAVPADASNAVAAAYRSAEVCVVSGGEGEPGALVVPVVGPGGCIGAFALELRRGGECMESVRAFATIVAAQIAMLFGSELLAEAAAG
jgi:hypothetical protein